MRFRFLSVACLAIMASPEIHHRIHKPGSIGKTTGLFDSAYPLFFPSFSQTNKKWNRVSQKKRRLKRRQKGK